MWHSEVGWSPLDITSMVTQQSGSWGISINFDPSPAVNFLAGSMTNYWEVRFTFTVTDSGITSAPTSMPSPAPSPVPSPVPTSKPSVGCADSTLTVDGKGCPWVAVNPAARCPLCVGAICAAAYCPVTCGTCP